jgi:carboxyl-terminal processing protease
VAYVDPVSPAATAGIRRGDVLVSVNGVSADVATPAGVDALNAALFPSTQSASSFVLSRNGSTFNATLTATTVTKDPVPSVPTRVFNLGAGGRVGYIVFHDHIATSEAKLIAAVTDLNAQGPINDLVLDLRYNGGGYLFIASELAYMIAGSARTSGKVFEKSQYNNKRTADNAQPGTPFYNTSCIIDSNFNCTSQVQLPTLNLPRVYVLTSRNTCSASEAIVNALRGVDLDVRLIGPGATCGKPYGFTAKDNCGISYFPIEFKGVNAKGFGDYADGFLPTCTVADDFSKPLGDPTEGQLAAALSHRLTGACPPAAAATSGLSKLSLGTADGFVNRGPVRENRIVVPSQR